MWYTSRMILRPKIYQKLTVAHIFIHDGTFPSFYLSLSLSTLYSLSQLVGNKSSKDYRKGAQEWLMTSMWSKLCATMHKHPSWRQHEPFRHCEMACGLRHHGLLSPLKCICICSHKINSINGNALQAHCVAQHEKKWTKNRFPQWIKKRKLTLFFSLEVLETNWLWQRFFTFKSVY